MVDKKIYEFAKCAKDPVYYINTYGHVFDAQKKMVCQMTCFEYQNDCLRDFHKNQNNIILKSRQCLPEDTFVDTPDGPKTIQDFNVGDFVYSYNLETEQVEVDTVADAWLSGDRQCIKLKLKDSRNIEVGENHPFWIVNKQAWIKAKDLDINDEILDANIGFGDVSVSVDEIKILAYLITDGCTNKQVKFTNNNVDYLSEFENSVNVCFPDLYIRKSPKLNGYDYYPHQKHGVNTLNPLMEWCENKQIANKKTEFKNLPEEVFYWNKKSLSLLINRMFAGDGWVSILKKTGNKRLELGLGSPSLVFLEQVKMLLKKYNIKGNIYEVKNMKLQKNKFYKLRITHSKSVSKFISEIGIYKKVNQEHFDIINNRVHDVKNTSVVRKKEKTETKKCYDISVTKNENFLINGLLVHNTGLSVITAGYVAWRLLFRYDEKILIIANDGAGAIRFLETVKQFISHTPGWLKPDAIETDNTKKIQFSNNSYAEAKASSPNAGRGDSLTMLVLDETAFIKDDEAIWMGAGMALSQTGGKCIMISTPNGTGNLYYKTWVDAVGGVNDFVGKTVHWTENPNSIDGLEYKIDPSGEKLPWSPWYDAQCKRLNFDSVKIAQELDLSFEGSKRLAVDPLLVSKYHAKVQKDNKVEGYIRFNYLEKEDFFEFAKMVGDVTNMTIFKHPEEGKQYILGADVARGDGQDYSTIQILEIDTLEQVAEFREKISPDLFPFVINHMARMYNMAYVVIEANSFGLGVCFDIRDKFKYPKNRQFYSKNIKDIHVRHHKYKISEGTEIPGFQTSRKNRVLLVKAIIEHMRENSLILHSKRLMVEFQTFVMNGDKPEHEPGFNDDLILALGIALYIRDTEFENVTSSTEMYKSMLNAMLINTTSSVDKIPTPGKKIDIPQGGGGLYIFNGDNSNINFNGDNRNNQEDDTSWLLGN